MLTICIDPQSMNQPAPLTLQPVTCVQATFWSQSVAREPCLLQDTRQVGNQAEPSALLSFY